MVHGLQSVLGMITNINQGDKMLLKRTCPGYYAFSNGYGTKGIIRQLSSECKGWVGYWMVEVGQFEYSDPVKTYKEAKRIAENWV